MVSTETEATFAFVFSFILLAILVGFVIVYFQIRLVQDIHTTQLEYLHNQLEFLKRSIDDNNRLRSEGLQHNSMSLDVV